MPPRLPRSLLQQLRLARPSAAPPLLLRPAFRAIVLPGMRPRAVPRHQDTYIINEHIPATGPEKLVLYIDNSGNSQGLRPLPELLRHLDRENFQLHCINPQVSGDPTVDPFIVKLTPITRIDDLRVRARERKAQDKANKRKPANTRKEIEFTWAVSEYDLGHRLKRIREFLEKGYRVEITFRVKKKMAKQTLAHMEELVEKLERKLARWGREEREKEGEIGRSMTLNWVGVEKEKHLRGLEEKEDEYLKLEEEMEREEAEERGEGEEGAQEEGEEDEVVRTVPEEEEVVLVDREGKPHEPEVVDMTKLK